MRERSEEDPVTTAQSIPSPIPEPAVLDPHRVLSDNRDEMTLDEHRELSSRLEHALEQSCAYGNKLWHELQAAREYLLDCLPPGPRDLPTAARRGAKPEGPADDTGWDAWIHAYAEITSALAGPRGDSGHGMSEARLVAQERRG
jgi:hypothetical protein